MTAKHGARRIGAIIATVAAIGLAAPTAVLAQAATTVQNRQQASERVTIVSFDPTTRRLVVRKDSGETASFKVPPELHNVQNLKPGDVVTATYYLETEFALSPPNQPLPADTDTVLAARASKGELPAAVIASHMVVTGAVLGVDTQAHTLRVVSPQGGEVHTFAVSSPEGRQMLGKLKPGDKITAYVTEGLLISTQAS
jgi:hypothetical protein